MKKLLLFLFLSISYSTFAQTITLNFPAGSQCQQNIQLSYDPSNNVTDGGATWYTYKINEGSIKYNPNQTRWELLDGSTTIAYCLNETAPKPPASGWTDASNICGAPTLSGDVSVISLSPSTLPNATSGTAYSQTITASGGTGPYSFEVISGSLPASLTLSNGGVLSGTPTVAGTYNFRIKATDASSEYSHQAYTLIVTSPEINIQGNSATIADGDNTPSTTDHTDFGSTPVASGSLVRTFTIQNTGAGSLSISSVVVSGANAADFSVTAQPSTTVAASGFTTFEVTFNPSAGGVRNATVTVNSNDADEAVYDFAITGVGTDLIVSTTKSNVSCNGGANGSATVSTSGATGTVTYSWSPSGGNAATENGLAAGTYTVTVTDDNETETVNVTITQPDELVLPYAIPRGTLGEAYSASVVASGGISPYSYHLSGGALPSGLTLSTSGNITGTPSSAGAFYPTISVTDANGCLKWVNYNFVINKRDQSISFPAIASGIIYGDSPITLNASASSGLTVSYASSNPAVATISGQTLTIVGAGTADITASQPGNDNWNPAADKTQTITIGKKQLNVTADVKGKVYGAADPALTVSYSGFANGDDKDDLGGTLAISRASGENVGAYPIMPSGQTSGNYDIYYTGNSLIINKATLTVTADAKSKVYGATDPELTVSYSGFANGDDKDDLGGTLAISRASGENVGAYPIMPSGQTSGNYDIAYIDNNLTINKATLTVTADAGQSKPYGATDPVFTYTATGFANGEGTSILSGALSRAAGEAAGTYPIQLGTLSAGSNYTINFTGADFSIISTDTDGDGVPDDVEENQGTDPNDPADYKDTDGDSVPDYVEQQGTQATITTLNINGKEYTEPGELVHYTIDCANNTNTVSISLATSAGASSDSGLQFTIKTPSPGIYRKTITVSSLNGAESKAYQIMVEKKFQSEQIIEQKFNNVLLVNNNFNNNGGYTFVKYQWYKDRQKIGNGQYYSAGDAVTDRLDPNATYELAITTETGEVLHVCGFAIELALESNVLYPNPVTSGSVINVQTAFDSAELEGASIEIYSLTGIRLQQVIATENKTTLTIPDNLTSGIYLVVYKTARYQKTFKLVVTK